MATNTYVALDKQILSSSAASVTFGSISQAYTDLVLVINGYSANDVDWRLRMGNSTIDTGSNYSGTYIYATSSAVSTYRDTSSTGIGIGGAVTNNGINVVHIQNYSNTTTYKSVLTRVGSSGASSYTQTRVGMWRSTAAINTIQLSPDSGNYAAGSTFTLYGIANSNIGAPKAFGGTITQDATYTYHTFGASGTFTPTQSLTVDALVLAGGGGGGCAGGGGGAGSLIYRSAMAVTATGYSITIGSGGAGDATRTGVPAASGTASTFNSISATGGGGGASNNSNSAGAAGGSGGGGIGTGAGGAANAGTLNGGTGYVNVGGGGATGYYGSGGGGAGVAGATGTIANGTGGAGGNGINTFSSWLLTSGTGVSGYIAGGGGGGAGDLTTPGGLGGGGANGLGTDNGQNGTTNTGGGAGGSRNAGSGGGGTGGSGIVIIRYAN
jgi:hypothetical protein